MAFYRTGRRITLSGVSQVAVYSTLALSSPHKCSLSHNSSSLETQRKLQPLSPSKCLLLLASPISCSTYSFLPCEQSDFTAGRRDVPHGNAAVPGGLLCLAMVNEKILSAYLVSIHGSRLLQIYFKALSVLP